jgi:subtilase family serine protease
VGSAPAIPRGAVALGPAPGSRAIHLDIVLNPRDPAGLRALALAVSTPGSPEDGQFLTISQFAARFGQTPATIRAADSTLRHLGLNPGPAAKDGLIVPVSSTFRQAAKSLGVSFADYRLGSGRVAFANTTAPHLPSALANVTTAVIGLNDLVTVTPGPLDARNRAAAQSATLAGPSACKAASKEASSTHGWTYPKLASAYGINALFSQGHRGAGTRIALFELDRWSGSDIASFQKCYNTSVQISSVKVDGGDGSGVGEGEAALDIETAIALAPKAKVTVYDAPESNYALSAVDEYAKIFNDDSAQIVSVSYGLCESVAEGISSGLIPTENTLFEQAATEGMSVLAASGDTGSEGCYRVNKSKALATLDPASQPFITAVGGTSLTAVQTPPTEKVWNDGVKSKAGAAGGGISTVWAMPPWQSGPGVVNSDSSGTPCAASSGYCREVPDVAASADPKHGYIIRWNGKWIAIGGTSAATPLWAAMIADIESAHSPVYRAGLLNPVLYAAAATGTTSFNDITSGNNDYTGSHSGLFPARTHYDMGSGLGTPKAKGLLADFNKANSPISFTGAPGNGSPPARLGTYKITAFNAPCTPGTYYTDIAAPTGTLALSPSMECEDVGGGWQTWSNGYAGDVYWNNANEGGTTTDVLTLPAGTRAFYFYAEPNEFETFDLEATAQNGTTSGPLQVYGDSGAQYYGFYSNGPGSDIAKITITCDDDFAIGEFGIAK